MRKLILALLYLLTSCDKGEKYLTVDFRTFNEATTLTFDSYYHDDSDCGEFGGHHESIKIKKENEQIVYYYKRDSTDCPKEMKVRRRLPPDRPDSTRGQLISSKQKILLEYLNDLLTHKPSLNLISNATNIYEVQLETRFWTKTYKLSPVERQWTSYIKMRDQLIK